MDCRVKPGNDARGASGFVKLGIISAVVFRVDELAKAFVVRRFSQRDAIMILADVDSRHGLLHARGQDDDAVAAGVENPEIAGIRRPRLASKRRIGGGGGTAPAK